MPLLLQAEGHGAAQDIAPYNGSSDSPRTPPLDHRVQRSGSGTPPSLEGAGFSRDDGALPPLQAYGILTPEAADFSVIRLCLAYTMGFMKRTQGMLTQADSVDTK